MKKLLLFFVISLVNLTSYSQWSPTAPTVVCNAIRQQSNPSIIADGVGGYIIAWMDYRSGGNSPEFADIYIQRLNADGISQWTTNGLLVSGAPNEQSYPLLALCKTSNNQTRAMVVWRDNQVINNSTQTKIYAQTYDLDGNAQWAMGGVQVADCNGISGYIHNVMPALDGQRVMLAWAKKPTSSKYPLYIQAIDPDNGNTLYPGDGTLLDSEIADFNELRVKLGQAEESSDTHVVWRSERNEAGIYSANIYAQRIDPATGNKQWNNPTKVCIAALNQSHIQVHGDIVVWTDERNYTSANQNNEIFAQRIKSDGSVAWATNGINVSNESGSQRWPRIASAGLHSIWITWTDEELNSKDSSFVTLQKINSDGSLVFNNQGLKLTSNSGFSVQTMVVNQDDGGALVVYKGGVLGSGYRAHKISALGQKLWGAIGQPINGLSANCLTSLLTLEGISLAGGGVVFATFGGCGGDDILAFRAKICDTPPTPPIVVSPYRRCMPGSYEVRALSSGCTSGIVRYYTAPDGLNLLNANNGPQLYNRDTTQYVYAECIINGCASIAPMTPAHIQIAETSYTNAQLLPIYPKTVNDLPTVALSQTTITAQNAVNPPANVLYQATQSVLLNPGFQANQGAVFRAEVKTCVNLN